MTGLVTCTCTLSKVIDTRGDGVCCYLYHVTLHELSSLCVPLFPNLCNGDDNSSCLMGLE